MEKLKKILQENGYFISFFLISFFAYAIWLRAFFPGMMSPDSINQWTQAGSRIYNDAHPFLGTFLMTLLRFIWDSPAIIGLFQIFVSSFIIAYSLNFFLKQGISKTKIVIVFFIFLILPSVGVYNITLWKDVLFAQCIAFLSIIFVKNYISQEKITNSGITLVAFLTILICNIRHNGVIYFLVVPAVYFLFRIVNLKKLFILISCTVLFYIFFNIILFNILNVSNARDFLPTEFIRLQIIGNAIRMGYNPTKNEVNTLEKVMPIDEFRKLYDCSTVNSIMMGPKMNTNILLNDIFISDLNKIIDNIILNNLQYAITDRTCLFSVLVGMGPLSSQFLYQPGIYENTLNLEQHPNRRLNIFLSQYLDWSKEYPQRSIFWSHFFYILLYIYFLITAICKKNYTLLGFIILITVNIPAIFIFGLSKDFRYLYMIQFALPFIFLVDNVRKKDNPIIG
ncbi:MAG: hypothetical protein NTZ87_00095 [Candidatus Nomurabacteria bacterium]|nr:hypothetical protein [Candidatus Nomurabacteria bacterium]